ncbi:MAG: hypothetical protein ACTSSB_14095, partial [Candidatus Heimdallarchaeota archaeon]
IDDSCLCWNKIVSIQEIKLEKAFDLTTKDLNHNFVANGIFSFNCSPFNADRTTFSCYFRPSIGNR